MERPTQSGTFDVFYERNFETTLAVIYALCGSWSVAEEVCQEAFARAYRRWGEVSGMEHSEAWVRRVASNLAMSRLRRLSIEARSVGRLARRGREQAAEPLSEELEVFWQRVRRLPRRQAVAVALYYADDLPVREVAEVMRCAEGTVKAHLHAARQRLGEMYEAEWENGDDVFQSG